MHKIKDITRIFVYAAEAEDTLRGPRQKKQAVPRRNCLPVNLFNKSIVINLFKSIVINLFN